MLNEAKSFLREQLGLPPSAVLMVAGLVAHLALTALLRKSPTSPWGLLAPLTLGLALEAYEIWMHYRTVGLLAPGNDPLWLILARHGLDVMKVLAAPILITIIGRMISR